MHNLHMSCLPAERSTTLHVATAQGRVVFKGETVQAALSWLWLHGHREVLIETDHGAEHFLVERNLDPPGNGSALRLRRRPPDRSSGPDVSECLKLPLNIKTRSSQDSATTASAFHRRRRGPGR